MMKVNKLRWVTIFHSADGAIYYFRNETQYHRPKNNSFKSEMARVMEVESILKY